MSKGQKNDKKLPKEYRNAEEIRRLVDQVIQKNKVKLSTAYEDRIKTNNPLLKDDKNSSFYLKKNKDNKKEKISKEIISQARNNLGEEPTDMKEEEIPELEVVDKKTEKPKAKVRIRFGKPKKQEKEIEDKLQKTDDMLESEEFDEVVKGIEKTSEKEVKEEKSKDTKFLDEQIKKQKEEIKSKPEISPEAEKKVTELAKKHGFLDKKTKEASSDEKKYISKEEKAGESDFSEESDNDAKFLESQIKDFKMKSESTKTEEIKIEEPNKKDDLKTKTVEKTDGDTERREPFKPRFKVENIPVSQSNEQSLIDEKLKKNTAEQIDIDNFNKIQKQAQDLVKEHTKDKKIEISNPIQRKDEEKKETTFNDDITKTNSSKEHVFFDEGDTEFSGWSPHITDKERKALSNTVGNSEELGGGRLDNYGDLELPKEVLSVKSVKLSELGFSENEWEELEFYPLFEPFAYVEVLREKETLEKCYFLVEIELTEEEQQTMDFIIDTISNISIDTEDFENKNDEQYLAESVNKVVKEYNIKVDSDSFNKILYYLAKSSLGMGKIDPLMHDPNIEDISCDGAGVPLFLYHRTFGSLKSNIQFDAGDELNSFVHRLAQKCGKHISIAEPMLDATMPDGSRIQMTLSDEVTTRGSTFTIRKFRDDPFSPPDLVEFNTMSSEMIAYMWIAVENRINMLFAGGTASGKTTALNALSLFIPNEAKIVSIEETREINLPHPNWIPGVARTGFGQVVADKMVGEIDLYDLMKAALRQRPEYILVGEIRGREAYVLFQAMATGHTTYSTVHADSAHSLIHRLEGKPINIPRVMLQSLDVVSLHVITRVKNKRARRCKQLIEIIDIDPTTKEILTNEVFRWDPVDDKFIYSGKSYVLERIRAEKDMNREEMTEEIKRRKRIIQIMNDKNIREFRDVARVISRYADNPVETFKQLEKDAKKK